MKVSSHRSKNTSADHLVKFYDNFDVLRRNYYDGLIITGVRRWSICLMKKSITGRSCAASWTGAAPHVYSTMHICWGAQAGLYYHYGIDKHLLHAKDVRHLSPEAV